MKGNSVNNKTYMYRTAVTSYVYVHCFHEALCYGVLLELCIPEVHTKIYG